MKTLYTALLITAMSVAAATAQPGRGDGQGYQGEKGKQRPNPGMMLEQLNLTPEQQKAVREARESWQESTIDLRANVQKAKMAVRKQLNAETVNRDALMSAVEAEGAAETAMRKAMVTHQLVVRDIIGAEKAEQLMAMMREMRGGGTGGPREGRGPGSQKGPQKE